jgi:hypothetical protein
MTAVIQVSYIHRGLPYTFIGGYLGQPSQPVKRGIHLTFEYLVLLESSAKARHLFAEVFRWYMTDIYWNLLLVYGC